MAPVSQTLFSVALFLSLSFLLAWCNRRQRGARQLGDAATVPVVRHNQPARTR
jgi:hypothetical protein